jgi:cytochrome c oxidase cbb3-type subunit 3
VVAIVLAALALALAACERPPSADSLREWTPADHHSSDDDKLAAGSTQGAAARAGQGGQAAQKKGARDPSGGDVTELVDLTWRQQCSNCHGAMGKGDGQIGPMVKAPDLTLEAWQSQVTDEEIAATIRNGKGKMPNFDVPDSVVRGLVARVRAARGR